MLRNQRKPFRRITTAACAAVAAAIAALTLTPAVVMSEAPKTDLTIHVPLETLEANINKYAPVKLSYDESVISPAERMALIKLVKAADMMDEIFLRQVWAGNVALRADLVHAMATDAENKELLKDLYHFFKINFGPWDRLQEDAPFLGGREKPAGAGFYPEDLTVAEMNAHLQAHPEDKEAFEGFFTTIERRDGGLVAVPYSEAYKDLLDKAAALLEEAAIVLTDERHAKNIKGDTDYTTLATYLRGRAAAFKSNDYFQSDMDWMDVKDNIVDVTIGPYEVYEDGLFGYKAAFEAFIAIRYPADSKKLLDLKNYLPSMERNLPIDEQHKNMNRGTESPISVVDVVFAAGDTKAGVQTIAFNLPNDERVREAKGSKKVMLKNLARAKFDKILAPIAEQVLDPAQKDMVNFDTYFNNTLMHELAHGLGPGNITLADGTETTVGRALKTHYSAIEEAKADITGLYNTGYLVKQGYFPKEAETKAYINFLPGFFRAIRFGATSAHGKANMMEFNYMKQKGAITLDEKTGRYHVNLDKMPVAVRAMTAELLTIQALGDYEKAGAFIAAYGEMPDEVARQLKKLESIPTDIEPLYEAASFLEH